MKVTIIIPVHDGATFLPACLKAVEQAIAHALMQEGVQAAHALVVDNGSSDGSAALVAHQFPTVDLLTRPEALGFAGAVNLGIRRVLDQDKLLASDVIVLLNQDTEVQVDWLAALLVPLQRDPIVGVVGSKALFPDGRIQHAGGELSLPLGYGRNRGHGEPDTGQYDSEDEPDYLSGMAVALRVAMLEQIGLLDEGFNPAYYEDVDLCLRARAAGWKLFYAPGAVLTHAEGAVSAAGDYAHAALIERNRLRLVLKHMPVERLLTEFAVAEEAQLLERANDMMGHVLRRSYLDALLMLPELKENSTWKARADAVETMLFQLRQKAITSEREGRLKYQADIKPRAETTEQGAETENDALDADLNLDLRLSDLDPQTVAVVEDSAAELQPQIIDPKLPLIEDEEDEKVERDDHVAAASNDQTMETQPGVGLPTSQNLLHTQEEPASSDPHDVILAPSNDEALNSPALPPDPRPPTPPPVAIIILTWNGLHYTQECLDSLRALTTDVDYQMIVVDNGSTDGTREYLRSLDWVTLIENETNEGFTRGNNRGLRHVPPGYDVLLLNNDTRILQSNWLARMREAAHSDPTYGIVGCRLIMTDGRLVHAGTYMPTDTFWGWQIGSAEEDIGQYPGVREVEGVIGACVYIRRDALETIGPLDERFFSYFEDTDYCLMAQKAGYKIVCVGDVRVMHHENVSTKLNKVDWWGMFGHSQNLFIEKWDAYYRHERYHHRVLWHSMVSAPTGYAVSSRHLVLALDRLAVDVRLSYILGPDIHQPNSGDPRIEQMRVRPKDLRLPQVVYHQGDTFYKNSGRYRIGYTMLEVTGIPDDWVRQANQMDEVWVPSHFNLETFCESGVIRPIYVMPLGVDTNYFHPGIVGRRFSDRFTFLSVFEWGERKAPETLLRAYAEAFSAQDDVLLVLKVDNRDGDVNVAQQIANLGLPADGPPIMLLYNQALHAYQMGSLYRGADCFVLPTRGEGWGMPLLEAMACGLPTIGTNWSAQTEFMRPDVCYPLQVACLVPAVAKCPYYAGYYWAEPDQDHLVYLMRRVYKNRTESQAVGQRAAETVAREWTWDHAAQRILKRLREIE